MELIFENIKPNTHLITPNRRLAALIAKKYHDFQISQSKLCWETLDILPYVNWIERLWQQYSRDKINQSPQLLTPHEEQLLWEIILRDFPSNELLLQLSATADLAKSAWSLLKQWQIKLDHPLLKLTDDSLTFLQWAEAFRNKCEKENWIDFASITTILMAQIKARLIPLPDNLIVIGFTEFTEEQGILFSILEELGISVLYIENFSKNQQVEQLHRISLQDFETEITVMARFAKTFLTNKKGGIATLGCIIPNLETHRERILQIFNEIFKNNTEKEQLFNISAGKSLIQFPIIFAAFQFLKIPLRTLQHELLRFILYSPFIGEAESELNARAFFDTRTRNAAFTFELADKILNAESKIFLKKYCPALFSRLKKLYEKIKTFKKEYPADEWAEHFLGILKILGWPGERSLNSHEYQVVHRFLNLLNEFKSCSDMLPSLKYSEAVNFLTLISSTTMFQPESNEAPIQILGLLEALDIPFDYVWIVGMDDASWPPKANPNPFIPKLLQKNLQMPHASAERELRYTLRVMEQLKRSAKNIIFSHALKNEEGDLRGSSLLKNIPEININSLQLEEFISDEEVIFKNQHLEQLKDEIAPSITMDEKIFGGVNILKLTAACPFKAFAEIRLNAKKIAPIRLGVEPSTKGSIIHKSLELIWEELKTSENLKTIDEITLKKYIQEKNLIAIQEITGTDCQKNRYLQLELKRLNHILWQWLSFEKTRPFFRVLAKEQNKNIKIGPLELSVRIDRIDELADGTQLLIDYKTSKNTHIKHWFGERLKEPQLPLYCITYTKEVHAIAFAELHANYFLFKGLSKNLLEIENITPWHEANFSENNSWEQQCTAWHTHLEKLSHDFYNGSAKIDPADHETCQYCDLKSFCRIHENNL